MLRHCQFTGVRACCTPHLSTRLHLVALQVSQDGLPEAERLLNQSRALSQRAAAFSKRLAAETESLAEEVGRLDDAVDKALAGAAASTSAEWVKAVVHLESAKGVLHGNGPGGDL